MAASPTSGTTAGSRRFWVTVICFCILNTAAWVGYDRYFTWRHRGQLRVESFEPGDNAQVNGRPVIRWRFSEDVIPTTVYGKDPGRISPAIAGRWNWENPRTLIFEPAVDVPRATPVTFTLASDIIRSNTGGSLSQPYTASVHGAPLTLNTIQQSASIGSNQFVLDFKFNDRVNPGDLLNHLTVILPSGKTVHCQPYGEAASTTVRMETDSIPMPAQGEDLQLVLKISPGLTGSSGPMGLGSAVETSVILGTSLYATTLTPCPASRGQAYLSLAFNNTVDAGVVKSILSIDPPIKFTLESEYQSIYLHGDFQSGTRYTVTLGAAPKGTGHAMLPYYPKPGKLVAFFPDKPSEMWFDNQQGYLSTAGNRTLLAHVVNISAITVSITRMYDNNLVCWRNAQYGGRWDDVDTYAKPIARKTISTAAARNVQRDVPICLDDLIPANAARTGVWKVSITKSDGSSADSSDEGVDEDDDRPSRNRYRYRYGMNSTEAAVTLSDIGLTAKQTRQGLVAWAVSLRTAAPLANVRVRVFSSKNQPLGEAISDAQGLVNIPFEKPAAGETAAVLLADTQTAPTTAPSTQPEIGTAAVDSELTWLDLRGNAWELGDNPTSGQPYLRGGYSAYIYTDRGIYRPGETLRLRAILRQSGEVAPSQTFPVKWQLRRPDGRDWKSQTTLVETDGGTSLDLPLPADLPSGQWSVTLDLPGTADKHQASLGSATFLIEEFMPNRLKVDAHFAVADDKSPARYQISDTPLNVDVQADYLFGRPGSRLAVELTTHAARIPFAPTGWEGWSFGDTAAINSIKPVVAPVVRSHKNRNHPTHGQTASTPDSSDSAELAGDVEASNNTLDEHGHFETALDAADSVHFVPDDNSPSQYRGPWRLSLQAGVREMGGRAVTVSRQIDIDSVPAYIAAQMGSSNFKPGDPAEVKIKLVKPDGAPANETESVLQAELFHETWNTVLAFRDGYYHYDSSRVLDSVINERVNVSEGVANWSVTPPQNGQYVVRITEPLSGASTTISFYVAGPWGWDENVNRENPERLDLQLMPPEAPQTDEVANSKPAKALYHIGDTARVLVASPFTGRLLLSVETDDVVQTQVIDLKTSHQIVEVPVIAAAKPGAFISATVIRPIDPNTKWRTHRAYGVCRLNIDPADSRLRIAIDAPPLLRPGQSLDVNLRATDRAGAAVANATVTVAAVDEGICSLTNFKTPDPVAFFTQPRALGVRSGDLYSLLMPEIAKADGAHEVGGDRPDGDLGRNRSPVGARRVKPVALAWAVVHTDARGMCRASFPLPEFQGQLRVMAIGYSHDLSGNADKPVTVRSPVLAQTTWPRFAAPGDHFSVPITVFNNMPSGGEAAISVELVNDGSTVNGLLGFAGTGTERLDLPTIAMSPRGQAQTMLHVIVANAVGVAKVRLHLSLNGETFTEETELPVRPANSTGQFGGIAAAKANQAVTIGNLRQMMPGTGTLRVNVTPWPTLQVPQGLEYLDRYPYGCVEQTTSTCFPLIALAKIGRKIDPDRFDPQRIGSKISDGISHLIGMQTADGGLAMWSGGNADWPWASVYAAHFLTTAKKAGYEVPADFYEHLMVYVRHQLDVSTDDATTLEVQSYAAYVLALAGNPDRSAMDRLMELTSAPVRADDPSDALSMHNESQALLACAWLLSGRRDLAEGLLPDAIPQPRISRQLSGNIGSPTRDRALLALAFEQIEPDRPELVQLVQQLADQGERQQWCSTQDVAFSVLAVGQYLELQKNRSPFDRVQLKMGDDLLASSDSGKSMTWVAAVSQAASGSALSLSASGPVDAMGFATWIQTGIPINPVPAASHDLKVTRRYLTLDNKPLGEMVRTGELVRAEITIEGSPQLNNVVIEDLLPAGLEIENPRLETAAKEEAKDADSESPAADQIPAFGNGMTDIRDDRVVIVGSIPFTGKGRVSYLARAVTPGVYTAPPVHAEAMYDLNTNATSASGKLTVRSAIEEVTGAE